MEKKLLALLTSLERLRTIADRKSRAQVENGRTVGAQERANNCGASAAYFYCIQEIRKVIQPEV